MDMTTERQTELLILFAGYISAIPLSERGPITVELNEVLAAINVDEAVANPH